MRPNLPPRVFTGEFWHAHFNYAALRTDPALAAIGSMDGLAGDQICQWNSVAPNSILPATHLSVFVPPPLGAFVLANHQNHEDNKSTSASATHSSPIFSVQQNIQFPLPQVFSNQDELLSLARLSAAEGYLSEEVIPFLGHSNQQMTFKKVRWALRFPLPPPSKDPAARRFSSEQDGLSFIEHWGGSGAPGCPLSLLSLWVIPQQFSHCWMQLKVDGRTCGSLARSYLGEFLLSTPFGHAVETGSLSPPPWFLSLW